MCCTNADLMALFNRHSRVPQGSYRIPDVEKRLMYIVYCKRLCWSFEPERFIDLGTSLIRKPGIFIVLTADGDAKSVHRMKLLISPEDTLSNIISVWTEPGLFFSPKPRPPNY